MVGPFASMRHNGRTLRLCPWLKAHTPLDGYVPAGSLAREFRATIADFPKQPGFLVPDAARVTHWRACLEALGPGPYVGLCWRSGLKTAARSKYYAPLDLWGPVLERRDLTFVSLQYDECVKELAAASARFGTPIHVLDGIDLRRDLDENAALCAALDLVLSAPTAAGALAGAVGTETWFLTLGPVWPMLGQSAYPWYPGSRVLMAPRFGAWAALLAETGTALTAWRAARVTYPCPRRSGACRRARRHGRGPHMSEHVIWSAEAGLLHIRINRPAKKNALNAAMYPVLTEALHRAEADDTIRVVLLAGTGDSFTAGNDIADFLSGAALDESSPVGTFLATLAAFQKPLVAAVNGLAIGVGTTLLLHCDLVYAAESARFRLPFVDLGLLPEAASTLLLPRLIGHVRAAEYLLLCEGFDAPTARTLGLVNAVVPDAALERTARDAAQRLASKPPAAVRLTKRLMKSQDVSVPVRIVEEMQHFVEQLRSPEAQEALTAFHEKRPPDFSRLQPLPRNKAGN